MKTVYIVLKLSAYEVGLFSNLPVGTLSDKLYLFINPCNQECDALKSYPAESRIRFLKYYVVGEEAQVLI